MNLDISPVNGFLARRGIRSAGSCPREHLFLPSDPSPEAVEALYRLWSEYGFRVFVRDLLNSPEGASIDRLSRYPSEDATTRFLSSLIDLGMVEKVNDNLYRPLVGDPSSFGVTLEWFVSRVLEREFAAPAVWSVRLKEIPSGDYDVLADLGGDLLYVELTGAPPKHVTEEQIAAFLERLIALQPDLAVYMVDTHLRMRDKLVVLFERVLRRFNLAGMENESLTRVEDECFHLGKRLYVTNTHRSLTVCLQRCFRHSAPRFFDLKE